MSPIAEVTEDAESSSTDDDHTLTSVSSAECSPPPTAVDDPNTDVEFQTISEGPMPRPPPPSGPKPLPENVTITAYDDDTVVYIDEVSLTASEDSRRNSSESIDVMDELERETKRPLIGRTSRNASQCSDKKSACKADDSTAAIPVRADSSEQVRDDVIVAIDDDEEDKVAVIDVVGTFFTPSVVDSFAEAAASPSPPPPCASEPLMNGDSPGKQVPDPSAAIADAVCDGRPENAAASAAQSTAILNNGADSSAAVSWSTLAPPTTTTTNRFGVAATSPRAESSASSAATSLWRRNPLARLVGHRKHTVHVNVYELIYTSSGRQIVGIFAHFAMHYTQCCCQDLSLGLETETETWTK